MRSIFFAMILFASVNSKGQTMMMNDETTDIRFVTHHVAGQLEGTFKGVKGSAVLDTNNLPASYLKLAFATTTLEQNDNLAGPNLVRRSCFDPSQYPQIELSSTSITKLAGNNRYQFSGNLEVKGITRPITFPFTAKPNVGGYDYSFTFPLLKKAFHLHCAVRKKFMITVRAYGKKE